MNGRNIRAPRGGVRPTQDRVRAAIFSALGGRVKGAVVLDIFAGTGALGLEARSRAAKQVCWVERNPRIFRSLRANVADLCGVDEAKTCCLAVDAWKFLARSRLQYDLILADPPYAHGEENTARLAAMLQLLARTGILRPSGVLVYEQHARNEGIVQAGWILARDKRYGDSRVLFYRRTAETARTGDLS